MKKFTLKDQAKNRLRPEDRCSAFRVAGGCDDSLSVVRAVYDLAGR